MKILSQVHVEVKVFIYISLINLLLVKRHLTTRFDFFITEKPCDEK